MLNSIPRNNLLQELRVNSEESLHVKYLESDMSLRLLGLSDLVRQLLSLLLHGLLFLDHQHVIM